MEAVLDGARQPRADGVGTVHLHDAGHRIDTLQRLQLAGRCQGCIEFGAVHILPEVAQVLRTNKKKSKALLRQRCARALGGVSSLTWLSLTALCQSVDPLALWAVAKCAANM